MRSASRPAPHPPIADEINVALAIMPASVFDRLQRPIRTGIAKEKS
jgi:hypothetical protein